MVTKVEILELVPMNTLDSRPRAWFDASPMMVTVRSDEQYIRIKIVLNCNIKLTFKLGMRPKKCTVYIGHILIIL